MDLKQRIRQESENLNQQRPDAPPITRAMNSVKDGILVAINEMTVAELLANFSPSMRKAVAHELYEKFDGRELFDELCDSNTDEMRKNFNMDGS